MQFEVNRPPDILDIIVVGDPPNGTALETLFSMSCTGGKTDQPPLKFSLGYQTGDRDLSIPFDQEEFAKECTWVLLNCMFVSTFHFTFYAVPLLFFALPRTGM